MENSFKFSEVKGMIRCSSFLIVFLFLSNSRNIFIVDSNLLLM